MICELYTCICGALLNVIRLQAPVLTIRSLQRMPTLASMAKESVLCITLSSKLHLCLSTHCTLCCCAVLKEQCHRTHYSIHIVKHDLVHQATENSM